jgi:hypothetical protein
MIRIGFIINFDFKSWYGGTNVIKNLIYCIQKYSKNNYEPVLFVRKSLKKKDLREFNSIKVVKTNIFDISILNRIFYKIIILFFGRCSRFDTFFEKHNIKVISHVNTFAYNFFTGHKSSIKSISWVTDFQHLYYPEYFSIKNKILRNFNIFLCSLHSSKILVSSYEAQNDLKKVSKKAFRKSAVSQFYFKFDKSKDILGFSELKKIFNVKNNFFLISNQYWIHKNYEIVLESLFFLKKNNKLNNLLILSTGSSKDHRNKNYFDKIMKLVEKYNLNDNFKYLGVVTYQQVLSLMYYSIALINPSKFEGRNVSVEQARSMGKKIILSDIRIHREQNTPRTVFFNPNDYKKLASIIFSTCIKHDINIEKKNNQKIKDTNTYNLFKYYQNYEKIIKSVINLN